MHYKVEIEERRLGWVEVEAEPDELLGDVREKARGMVEEGELVPVWSDDSTIHTCRMYDVDAPCRQFIGSTTPYCITHELPFEKGLDVCCRRLEDVALRLDQAQEKMW